MPLIIRTEESFAQDIEQLVMEREISYIDACLEYAAENQLEVEDIAKLVGKTLRQKLKKEATDLNFLGKKTPEIVFE